MPSATLEAFPGNVYIGSHLVVGTETPTTTDNLHVYGTMYATDNITAFSDKRGKENIDRIEGALDKISKLCGYTYNLKSNGKRSTGLVAQEVLEVLPEAVAGSEETNYALSYGNMMGLVVEAIKELKREIEKIKQFR